MKLSNVSIPFWLFAKKSTVLAERDARFDRPYVIVVGMAMLFWVDLSVRAGR